MANSRERLLVSSNRYDFLCQTRTSVEHDGCDYYLAGYNAVNMDGLTILIRKAV